MIIDITVLKTIASIGSRCCNDKQLNMCGMCLFLAAARVRRPDVLHEPLAAPRVDMATVTAMKSAKAVEYTPPNVTATAPDEMILCGDKIVKQDKFVKMYKSVTLGIVIFKVGL